jgi:hypothetical protein
LISQDQINFFNSEGYLILPGFYDYEKDILPIQKDIYEIIGIVSKKYNIMIARGPFEPNKFDECYLDIIKVNRSYGGEIYDAVKQIPAFIRLVTNSKNDDVFKALRPNSLPGIAAAGYGIRINNPFEDKYRANWHQEYPAQLRSLDGLVFWSPLINVSADEGPVTICPKSQVEGPIPVHTTDTRNKEKQGAYSLVLRDEDSLIKKYQQISPLSQPADLIIMDFLTIHASGFNKSNRALWSMQFRYFNYLEKTGLKHGWKGGFASGVDFRNIHPELCIDYR